jgi:type VI secretion system secreted protein Hcp
MLPALPAMAAHQAYMSITGTKQGSFKGQGPSGKIEITSVSHNVTMASGMAAGKRQHGEITITKEVDSASPKLFQALSTNETLSDVTIEFTGSGAGAGKAAQRITLTNAIITSDRKSGNIETITIEYEAITVTYVNGGKTATDDWLAPS